MMSSGQPVSSPLNGRGHAPHTNIPTTAYARLAYACNAALDRGEMPGFTCDAAAAAIEAGTLLQELRGGLSDAARLADIEPWEEMIIDTLREYWASYGSVVMADVRADNRGLCLVLGMAMKLMALSHEQAQRSCK